MNKKFLYNALLSAMVALPLCFTSCSDDDEEDDNKTPNTIVDNGTTPGGGVVKIENGTLMGGKFSVSEDKQVYFSKGNLLKTGNSYSFAPDQTTIIGEANLGGATKDLMNWMDVSGMTLENNTWRCLSRQEWKYLVTKRPNAASMCMFAQVVKNGIARRGTIIFPDGFTMPAKHSYRLGLEFKWTEVDAVYAANNLTEAQWNVFESQGALFLPHAGSCSGYDVNDNWYMYKDESAGYWSSDLESIVSYTASFGEYSFTCDYQTGLDFYFSFRLVRDVE